MRAILGDEWRARRVGGEGGREGLLCGPGLVGPGLGGAREMNEGLARRVGGCNEWSLASEPPMGDGRASVEAAAEGIGVTKSDKAASRASSSSLRPA